MDDLLKNAIADAKAVRETALVNAKLALEEAFTPKIQSMLSKKIQSETEGEAEEGEEIPAEEEEEEFEEEGEEEVPADEEGEEVPAEDAEGGEDMEKDVDVAVGDEEAEEGEEVPAEEEEEAEEGEYEEDLDLEAIIRELEGEEAEEGDDEEVAESEEAEEDEEAVEEQSDSSKIGSGDNKVDVADSGDEEDPQGAGVKSDSMDETLDIELTEDDDEDDVEENIDLEEILKSLSEDEEAEEGEEEVAEVAKLKSDLGEHRTVIKFLRSKLNEVNLLNAKLLFTNKLFKAFNLNNDEKLKVVETFDRANNLREVKLVYSTLAESYGYAGGVNRIPKVKISEGSASKPVASTKPKKVISEGGDLANRFKKLAGLND